MRRTKAEWKRIQESEYIQKHMKPKYIWVKWRDTGEWECLGKTKFEKDFTYGRFYGYNARVYPVPERVSPFIETHKVLLTNNREEAQCQLN